MRVRARRLGSILALLAATVFTLWTPLHGAMVSEQGLGLIEVCTAQGSKWVPAADLGLPAPPAEPQAENPCAKCMPAFTGLVLPVLFVWSGLSPVRGEPSVWQVAQPPLPEQPANAAQPRAPPSFAS
jgi:hypothetical protein